MTNAQAALLATSNRYKDAYEDDFMRKLNDYYEWLNIKDKEMFDKIRE